MDAIHRGFGFRFSTTTIKHLCTNTKQPIYWQIVMLDDFPATQGPAREAKILEYVRSKKVTFSLVTITSEYNGHKGEFQVFEDALKIDGVRVNVTADTQQQIADLLGCVLPTAKLYDLMWLECNHKIPPHPRPITSSTQAMIDHSKQIDEDLAKTNAQGLKSTVGKTWIIHNSLASKPGKACNYGWHFEGVTFKGIKGHLVESKLKNPNTNDYIRVIQPASLFHDPKHTDYSQVCVLVSRKCRVDEKEMDILDVLKDPELAILANHDGILKALRQPGTPQLEPIIEEVEPLEEPEIIIDSPQELIPAIIKEEPKGLVETIIGLFMTLLGRG